MCRGVPFFGLDILRLRERLEEFFLFFRKSCRDPNINTDDLVTAAMAVQIRDAFVAHTQKLSRLCSRFNLQPGTAGKSRNFHISTCRRVGKTHQQIEDNISVEEARSAHRDIRAYYHRLLQQMLPDMAQLLRSASIDWLSEEDRRNV